MFPTESTWSIPAQRAKARNFTPQTIEVSRFLNDLSAADHDQKRAIFSRLNTQALV
jgi:hypothetical protein